MKFFSILLASATITGCASMGQHDPVALASIDFGPEDSLSICVLVDDENTTHTQVDQLFAAVNQEFASYKLSVTVPWYKTWDRPGGHDHWIIEKLAEMKLPAPCDRMMAIVGNTRAIETRSQGGMMVLGSVDTVTHSRGFVVWDVDGMTQLLASPEAVMVHETYHMVGCEHDMPMKICYDRINRLKSAARQNRANGRQFFPTYSSRGQLLNSREEVDIREDVALRIHQAQEIAENKQHH